MMKTMMKKCVNKFFSSFGFELVRLESEQKKNYHHAMPSCEERLKHTKTLGFMPKQVIDAGAFVGNWTKMVAAIFPESRFTVVEPNKYVVNSISKNLGDIGDRVEIFELALADMPGEVQNSTFGGTQS